MRIQKNRLARLLKLMILLVVIGITWYVYEDYVNSTSAQNLSPQEPTQNKVIQNADKNVVQGTIEIAPKPDGMLIVPAE